MSTRRVTSPYFIVCILLLVGAPAWANSLEKVLCQTSPQPVARMVGSEKFCRSFARALAQLPEEAAHEVGAMLTPENLTVMASMTAAWLGTQGIPIVGQAVDATLIALGVTLLALQAATLSDSLWSYVNRVSTARSEADLDMAAAHLAKAIAMVGINVVVFILTKKAVGKAGPGSTASVQLQTAEGIQVTTSVARAASRAVPAPAVAAVGMLSNADHAPHGNEASKRADPKAFEEWTNQAERRPTRSSPEAYRYQKEQAGPEEFLLEGGGEHVWTDGVRKSDATLMEAKHVETPERSPFIPGSKCNERIRLLVKEELTDEFRRYAAVIKDPNTPAVALEVITNDARAVPLFQSLLDLFGIPGRVVVRGRGFP
ncbi:hypothetical protein JRI60_04610 [Archangium violaceum]|uniref:restriction endonuclease fold toxin-2 domain-containing protein n=1 Tax=Archangium violaceum TaxID=83451 RepID=UPI00194EC4B5|nr:restriction endonuclease fold toxin-2 domain-containing protein [Archangium violaceum]QRN98349.1 hypothetical protein JRI60_04610 [Archangium violaceum]